MIRSSVFVLPALLAALPLLLPAQERCLAEEVAARNALRFPDLPAERARIEAGMGRQAPAGGPRSVVQIPVVVHVVYKGGFENISDAQIQSQIEVLNIDYRHLNMNSVPPEFQGLAADVEIEFCLASYNPVGYATTGITRTYTTYPYIGNLLAPDGSPRVCYAAYGGHDAWDPEHYLNIWVASIGSGILGYGTYPGSSPPDEQGVVIDPRYFGTVGLAALNPPNHLGRTATHEIGHYFNLRHIWGANSNVCDDDDFVDDTPVQRSAYQNCPVHPQLSCGNHAMFMNFMDYTDDACMALFTAGQKNRVWTTLTTTRPGLIDGPGCSAALDIPSVGPRHALRLFPNPADTRLNLESDVLLAPASTVYVCDMWGRRQAVQTETPDNSARIIHTESLLPGVYLLEIETAENRVLSGVFVKN